VALDLELTPELAREGLARELVRLVQDARKGAGLQVTDRIEVTLEARGPLAEAIDAHRGWIAGEVLATRLEVGPAGTVENAKRLDVEGHPVAIALRKA